MKAAVVDRYGPPDVVRVADVPTPEPGAGEVRVRVDTAAVTVADARIRGARFPHGFAPFARLAFGVTRPRRTILGNTFSGVVEQIGPKVDTFDVGDPVCGMTGMRMGAHAEHVVVAARRIVHTPSEVSHTDAAAVLFGGTTALHFLRDRARLRPGASVLVNGASGAVGTCAVQLATLLGGRVTAVTSTPNVALATRLGADRVVDYTTTDPFDTTDRYDVVLDTVGTVSPARGRRVLTADGRLLLVAADLWTTATPRRGVHTGTSPESPDDFRYLLDLVAAGKLTPVVDELGGLDDVAAAYARIDSGHKVGNLVITPGS